MNKNVIKKIIDKEDSLDILQAYVLKNSNKNINDEMFQLFFGVIELGREIRLSLKNNNYKRSEDKISDIFLTLISICSNLNIDLFNALQEKI